jgi:rod shape-determining protein MreB and related proteins
MWHLVKKNYARLHDAFTHELAIDIGTDFIRIKKLGEPNLLEIPHVVAVEQGNRILAIGEDAKALKGKVSKGIAIVYPFEHGVMREFSLSSNLYRQLINQVLGKFFLIKPVVMVSVPSDATKVERDAVTRAMYNAGARQVFLIVAPLAGAIGAGIPVAASNGNIVLSLGAGMTEIAVLSLGSVVFSKSLRMGSQTLDQVIAQGVKEQYGVEISLETAEQIKKELINFTAHKTHAVLKVHAKDIQTSHPREVEIQLKQVLPLLERPLKRISDLIFQFLEGLPPELAEDVVEKGIMMIGGGAQLSGYQFVLSQIIGVPVVVAEDAPHCVIRGVELALLNLDLYRRSISFSAQF